MVFRPGHELSAALYEHLAPVIAQELPDLRYAAALIGRGSDVLGFDTARSMDHDWGPRLSLVLAKRDYREHAEGVLDLIEEHLPQHIDGVAVDQHPAAQQPGGETTHNNTAGRSRPHGVTVWTLDELTADVLGLDGVSGGAVDTATWLSIPAQQLLEFTSGPILRDDDGDLTRVRAMLEFYPDQVWFAVMAAWWQRIAQREAFVGRCLELGDAIGARVIAAQIVRCAMNLALLQQRQYPPYAKWLGTALERSPRGDALVGLMDACLSASEPGVAVVELLLELGRIHDSLGITEPVGAEPSEFFDRPYPVIWAGKFSEALHGAITDARVRPLPFDVGSIDVITDSTLTVGNASFRAQLRAWWQN